MKLTFYKGPGDEDETVEGSEETTETATTGGETPGAGELVD